MLRSDRRAVERDGRGRDDFAGDAFQDERGAAGAPTGGAECVARRGGRCVAEGGIRGGDRAMTLGERIEEAKATIAEALADGAAACVTSSFQNEDMIVTRLTRELRPEIPVLFLDTGYHFAETYEYRDRMTAEWGL